MDLIVPNSQSDSKSEVELEANHDGCLRQSGLGLQIPAAKAVQGCKRDYIDSDDLDCVCFTLYYRGIVNTLLALAF